MLRRDCVLSAEAFVHPSTPAAVRRDGVDWPVSRPGRPEAWPGPVRVMRAFAVAAAVGSCVWLLLIWVAVKLLF
jgi:hypothetical protein